MVHDMNNACAQLGNMTKNLKLFSEGNSRVGIGVGIGLEMGRFQGRFMGIDAHRVTLQGGMNRKGAEVEKGRRENTEETPVT